jgi:hypothetical protein
VHRVQVTGEHRLLDLVLREPQRLQLPDRDQVVLTPRQRRHPRPWATFVAVVMPRNVAHARM